MLSRKQREQHANKTHQGCVAYIQNLCAAHVRFREIREDPQSQRRPRSHTPIHTHAHSLARDGDPRSHKNICVANQPARSSPQKYIEMGRHQTDYSAQIIKNPPRGL